jgi:hypothetical protein
MKKSLSRSLYPTLLAIFSLNSLLTTSPASAQVDLTYNGATTYKDSKDNIYKVGTFYGGGGVGISYRGVATTRNINSDACGYAKVSFVDTTSTTPTTITAGGSSVTVASLPTVSGNQTPYKCTAGVVSWGSYYTPQTGSFVHTRSAANGSSTTTTVYLAPAQTGGINKQLALAYTADITSNFTPTTCGFVVFPGYATRRSSATPYDGNTAINVASLPLNPNPPKCVNNRAIVASGNGSQNGATMYRTKTAIYLTGLTAGSINTVDYNVLESKSFQNLSPCGAIAIDLKTLQPATLKAGGTTYTPASMAVTPFANLQCGSPSFASALADRLYKINNSTFVYKISDLTTKRLAIEIPTVVSRKIPVNQCGFSMIPALNRAEGFTTGDRVTINGSTPYNPITLPLVANAPQCSNGVTYTCSDPQS